MAAHAPSALPRLFPRSSYAWPFSAGPVYGPLVEESADLRGAVLLRTDVGSFDLTLGTPPFPPELRSNGEIDPRAGSYFIVVADPERTGDGVLERLREAIVNPGGAIVEEMGGAAYAVRLNAGAPAAIREIPGVLAVEPYHPAFKLSPHIGRSPLPDPVKAVSPIYDLDLLLFPGEDANAVARAIRNLGGNVLAVAPNAVRAELHRDRFANAAGIGAIRKIYEHLPVFVHGIETTTTMQTGSYHGGAVPFHDAKVNGGGLPGTCSASTTIQCQGNGDCPVAQTCNGAGTPQVLMILDSGIELDAGDLSDARTAPGIPGATHRKVRVYQTVNPFGGSGDLLGCDSATNGGSTHGHVVAATALGNATAVPLRYGAGWVERDHDGRSWPIDGVAPRAVLVAYDANVTPLSGSCGDPQNGALVIGSIYAGEGVGASLETAYHSHGARTYDFSWGTTNSPIYGSHANSVDSFLVSAAHPDAMIFLSAGNDGRDESADFVPDPGSISDPATAKNAVVVGGSGNTSEPVDGNDPYPQNVRYPFSGVGPATAVSQRVAPLLMAPAFDSGGRFQNGFPDAGLGTTAGDGVESGGMGFRSEFSCRSSDNDQNAPVECHVAQGLAGTSVASAAAAGAAMLVRDYFAQGFYPDATSGNPGNSSDVVTNLSGAMVKAILIASAAWMDASTPDSPTNAAGIPVRLSLNYRFNREQGYGRIQLDNALPLQSHNPSPIGMIVADGGVPGGRLDIPGLTGSINTTIGGSDTGTITVCDDARELRIALVWMDTTGDVLNRNLDLEVQSPSGKVYFGNYFTDDNNRNGVIDSGEDCPGSVITGSPTSLDESPWSLPACANSARDNRNPTEAVFLSPDPRRNGVEAGSETDKQTEAGIWTIRVKTGAGSASTTSQRYAVVVTGGVCPGSSIRFDRASYACNESVSVVVGERDEAGDPAAGLNAAEVAGRTVLEVVSTGADGVYGTADDTVADTEDGTSGLTFAQTGLSFGSSSIPIVVVATGTPRDGLLQVGSGTVLRATYQDETSGAANPNQKRTNLAAVVCQPSVSTAGVVFSQFGFDTAQLVEGGCERDARGLFTFGFPDRYMDSGERIGYRVAFRSSETADLTGVVVSLRCVLSDSDSPCECRPGTTDCADPDRTNNVPCGSLLTILDSPKNLGALPVGGIATPSFNIQMGTFSGLLKVQMLLGVSAKASGKPAESLLAFCDTLNADERSFFYSTDFPTGGSEVLDHDNDEVAENPSTNAGDASRDYRFDTMTWSSITATGRNVGFTGPWSFDSSGNGFRVGWNNTSTRGLAETVANWGEDKNFNGVLDYACALSPTIACPGAFPVQACGRCSNNSSIICVGSSNAPCGGGVTICVTDVSLGSCVSEEDRDPQNGLLDDNWSTVGGCGWQTNGTTSSPTTPGGAWHTGRIGVPGSPCLVSGSSPGACQSYEVLTGTSNVKTQWEILLSPVFEKVNQCNTEVGPLPAGCGGQLDTATEKVFEVEFMDWAWNMAADLPDRLAEIRYELDTDTTKPAPVDLINDDVVLNAITRDSMLDPTDKAFAPIQGSTSQNGTVGNNRVGRNPCYFEQTPRSHPLRLAEPKDDDLDNNGNGPVDELVSPNGPIRNFDLSLVGTPDMRFTTLDDVYGERPGESFQAAIGFRVLEGDTARGAAQPGFGVTVDDMVVKWREFRLVEDAVDCAATGACATVQTDSSTIFDGNGLLTITVTDTSPYRCVGGPPCAPEGKNDCNHNGSFADPVDDGDCDHDGTPDVPVRVFSGAEPAGEWVVLDRIGAGPSYRGTLPLSLGADAAGVLRVSEQGGLNDDITTRYIDDWDGTTSGSGCRNDADPFRQGIVDQGIDLVIGTTGNVVVTTFRVDDSASLAPLNDGDGYPDTNETFDLYVTISNKSHVNLTNVVLHAGVNDPKIECSIHSVAMMASLAADATVEVPSPFRFKVSATADRAGTAPAATCSNGACSNGAGPCVGSAQCMKTPSDDYSAQFTIPLSANQFDLNAAPQRIALDLDLDAVNPVIATSSFTEGFEGGFGNFQLLNLDANIASSTLSNGMRCPYSDPDFPGSNAYGNTECYLGFAAGQSPINDWHIHTTTSPDGGRAYLGNLSLHYGKHTPGNANLDTYGLSQMDALRTKNNINLAARVCAALQSGQVKSCNTPADCTSPASACVAASPVLSFKHQVSLLDSRGTNAPEGQAADRAVVYAQLSGSTVWQKIHPYENVYDQQATDSFANCTFDPVDDGNTEDSYFDPTDPSRRLGPSSTCFPEFVFSRSGATDGPFSPTHINLASDGPGLQGSLGQGTWVQSSFDLSRYRGRSIKLRFLVSTIKSSDTPTAEAAFVWNPRPDDDGWYIDDVRVTQALGTSSPTTTSDTQNHGSSSCGLPCSTLTPMLLAAPSPSPAPGRLVTLSASAIVDRCVDGVLLYQFWIDVDGNGAIGPIDVLLRDYGVDPVFRDAPDVTTRYLTQAKCTSSTSGPCAGSLAAAILVVLNVSCDDGNDCTLDTYVPQSGCVHTPLPNGMPCDDHEPCTEPDACSGGACVGAAVPAPAEVQGVRLARSGGSALITWNPVAGATGYDMIRVQGGLPVGRPGGIEVCIAEDLLGTSWTDGDNPFSNQLFVYVPRAQGSCRAGSYGYGGLRGVPSGLRETSTCSAVATCPAVPTPASCGNGVRDAGEECDGLEDPACVGLCRSDCICGHCGNGTIDAPEQCDDGNNANGDGCDADCVTETCGNGKVQAGEQCDGSQALACRQPGECQPGCVCATVSPSPTCGNGVVDDPAEECDGTADAACPGRCNAGSCTCAQATGVTSPPPVPGDGDQSSPPSNVIEVTQEAFDTLAALERGDSVHDHSSVPGLPSFIQSFFGQFPDPGAPTAICRNLVTPPRGPAAGCADLDSLEFDNGSYDADATPGALSLLISTNRVCGFGDHPVTLSVQDGSGRTGRCVANVRVCDPEQGAACPSLLCQDAAPPPDAPCNAKITCRWVQKVTAVPPSDTLIEDSDQALVRNGVGPNHSIHVNYSRANESRNCLSSDVEKTSAQAGTAVVNVNLVCLDSAGHACKPKCTCDVEAQGAYHSEIKVHTELGYVLGVSCFGFSDVNASAQDEAAFDINGGTVFNKAVAVQNGTNASTTVSFGLGATVGKAKEGASSELGASFGVSVTSSSNLGDDVDLLNALGGKSVGCTLRAVMESKGKAKIRVSRRSFGYAQAISTHWGIWWIGKSDCPEAGWINGHVGFGDQSDVRTIGDRQAANDFFETSGSDYRIPPP